jgi:thymidylate synthase (FAD)
MLLRVYDEDKNEFTVSHVEDVIYSGTKEVFEIETADGKTLKCTEDHLILTANGWRRLEDAVGLRRTQNKLAVMSKDCQVATNGTTEVWRSHNWLKARRDKGDPVQKIANEASCSSHTIRNWLRVHGLQYDSWQNPSGVLHHGRELDTSKEGTPLTAHYSKVEKIRYIGVVDTYDLVVIGPHHNFLANGIVVHNSYNEVSRRYTSVDIDFYYPPAWRQQSTSNKQGSEGEVDSTTARKLSEALTKHHQQGLQFYNQALEAGVAKEQARIFLPQSMYTQFIAKVDAHNLLHFIGLRMAPDAQYEIRVYAKAIFEEFVTPAIPWTAEAFERFVLNKD